MHNDGVRASSRLVLVWTSISLVAVAVAWAALSSAIQPPSEPPEVAALDPGMLSPKSPAKISPTVKSLPSPTASKATRPVTRARRAADGNGANASPPPSKRPTPRPTVVTSTPVIEAGKDSPDLPGRQNVPMEIVREVHATGGDATLGFSDGQVYLLSYEANPGFAPQNRETADGSVLMTFISAQHISTVRGYVDRTGTYHASIVEESR